MASSLFRGFTLIEAIVAMVIVSVLSMSLYSWLNVSYISANRAITTLNNTSVVASAKAYVEGLNPMAEPSGSYQLGDYYINWTSQALTEPTPVYSGSGLGAFDVALYRVDVALLKGQISDNGETIGTYSVELLGYNYARATIVQ